jgi:hypothetical protein
MPTAIVAATPADREVIPNVAPAGWERVVPRYRIVRELKPAEKTRFRLETPFSSMSDSNTWQFGTRVMTAGEVIETTEWPHPSFHPLNFSAKKTLEFYASGIRSRMARSPWQRDRLVLEDGLQSNGPPSYTKPRPQPFDLKPVA